MRAIDIYRAKFPNRIFHTDGSDVYPTDVDSYYAWLEENYNKALEAYQKWPTTSDDLNGIGCALIINEILHGRVE